MKYKLLIGDNIDKLGKKLANTFKLFGFDTVCCSNYLNVLEENLEKEHFDGCVFFAISVRETVFDFIRKCREKFSHLRIYPIITTDSTEVISKLMNCGATYCIIMPYLCYSVCIDIAWDFEPDRYSIMPEIADFLHQRKFPYTMLGFYFLCCGIDTALENPDFLLYSSTEIYNTIARKMNSTYENVEHALRVMLSNAFRKGVVINGQLETRRIRNKELITILTEEFIKSSENNL